MRACSCDGLSACKETQFPSAPRHGCVTRLGGSPPDMVCKRSGPATRGTQCEGHPQGLKTESTWRSVRAVRHRIRGHREDLVGGIGKHQRLVSMRTSAYTANTAIVMMMWLSTNGKAGKIGIIMNKLLSPGLKSGAKYRVVGNQKTKAIPARNNTLQPHCPSIPEMISFFSNRT